MIHRLPVDDYIRALKTTQSMDGQVVYHRQFAAADAIYGTPRRPWPVSIDTLLKGMGIDRLYQHQVQSVDHIRAGTHTVAATATASGKTLTYVLPVMEAVVDNPSTCALFIYPLKALAQDQLKTINRMSARLPDHTIQCDIYDGDTSSYRRKKIRDTPPHILMTNPEMVHLSICPHHPRWSDMLSRLRFVVVDEVHTYRGLLGSHMAQVFRRLMRICRHYGSAPTFVFTSATISNPDELASQLTGLTIETVNTNTAGKAKRHLLLVDPIDGPLTAALSLLRAALDRGLRTIVYTQSRKLTELLAMWTKARANEFADRISAYRAGFLPEERREIESKLASGELLAVISTSALELGIDIGSLDLCLLVGYPGSIVATKQRGGRVGRGGQESAVVLVAGEDALDQFFVKHPQQLVARQPEAAVVNAFNPIVLSRHLVCAAAELPLTIGESMLAGPAVQTGLHELVANGELYLSADGTTLFSPLKNPQRHVDLRGSGLRFSIVDAASNSRLGEIDGFRVYRETHPGAIYLHRGQTYLVNKLDPETKKVGVVASRVNFHTRVRSHKDTRILDVADQKAVHGAMMGIGRLRVSEQVTGYDRIHTRSGNVLARVALDLPPVVFETQGLWFKLPQTITKRAQQAWIHLMGGLHALEHATIGVFPLVVLADRNDLGGISTPYHPQLEGAAVFIYDGVPGGAGLCFQAFADGRELLEATRAAISECPCDTGCPSCVHSPKCGSGNRPIDKAGALFLLKALMSDPVVPTPFDLPPLPVTPVEEAAGQAHDKEPLAYGVLDIETQRSAQEVGGWHRADRMRVSCAVLYDSRSDTFFEFVEGQIPIMLAHLQQLDLVIGFNIKRFDYRVLSAYTNMDFGQIPTLDLMEKVTGQLGYRLSLDHLASATLKRGKTADGLDALRWWKAGKMAKILKYCRSDVEITRDLYRFGRKKRYLLFQNKAKQIVRLPVDW